MPGLPWYFEMERLQEMDDLQPKEVILVLDQSIHPDWCNHEPKKSQQIHQDVMEECVLFES